MEVSGSILGGVWKHSFMLFLMVHIGRLAGGADPSGGLGGVWTDVTTRELPGIWAGCVGVSGLAESAGKEFGQLAKNIAAY